MPENLTTDETAEMLRIKPQTLRAWRHAGRGPRSFKLGGRVLYAESDVRAFITAGRQKSEEHHAALVCALCGQPWPCAESALAAAPSDLPRLRATT